MKTQIKLLATIFLLLLLTTSCQKEVIEPVEPVEPIDECNCETLSFLGEYHEFTTLRSFGLIDCNGVLTYKLIDSEDLKGLELIEGNKYCDVELQHLHNIPRYK